MRKHWSRIGLAIATVLTAGVVYAATAAQAPEKITIDDCVAKKTAVEFPHKAHIDGNIACTTCHHAQEGLTATSTMEVQACGACHTTPEKADTPVCSQMSQTKNPFHITCVGCHKEEVKKNADSKAPTKCADCHIKA
jgi:Class III cytochrome C family